MSNTKKSYRRDERAKILTANGMTRTKTKLALIKELMLVQHPISISELHQRVGEKSCHLSTVFRAIQQFKAKNIVRELKLGEDFNRYELITIDDKDHIRCRSCGTFEKIEKINIEQLETIVKQMGFKDMSYRLDFSGVCHQCTT